MLTRLLALLALSVVASASPPLVVRQAPVSFPLARHVNQTAASSGQSILQAAQARAKQFVSPTSFSPDMLRKRPGTDKIPITNQAIGYTVDVAVGSPPTTYTLIVDTGSSNIWVGANADKPFVATNTSQATNIEVFKAYGSGLFVGFEFIDTVAIGGKGGLTIPQQSLGTAIVTLGNFGGFDGIMGIGPTDLTLGSLVTMENDTIPTVTDNAFKLGLIGTREVGLAFAPATLNIPGSVDFGGADPSKFLGPMHFVPISSGATASQFVGIEQSVTYGLPLLGGTTILPQTNNGVVDSGTSLMLIATDALARYQAATGATIDPTTGLLTITPAQYRKLKSLFFKIGDRTFEFTPNAQIWPRALNSVLGGAPGAIYLVMNDIGTLNGLDFLNGLPFLERFYTVFDSEHNRFGIAPTLFTHSEAN